MFVLDFTCKKCFRCCKPKIACFFLAHHQLYTMFVFHHLIVDVRCFPPNFYVLIYYLTFVVAAVSVVSGIMLWMSAFAKNRPKMLMGYLLIQHMSILYSFVMGLLLYGTNYDDTDECHSDYLIGGVSLLIVIWQCYVYICVNSRRVEKIEEEKKKVEEAESS